MTLLPKQQDYHWKLLRKIHKSTVKDTSVIYVWVNIIQNSYLLRIWSRHQKSFQTPNFLSSWLASENLLEPSFDKESTNHFHGCVPMKLCLVRRQSLAGRNWDCGRKSTKSDNPNLIIAPTRILLCDHKQVIVLWFKTGFIEMICNSL